MSVLQYFWFGILTLILAPAHEHDEIFFAVSDGNIQKVSELLESGIDINVTNDYGEGVLHLSAIAGDPELVKFLLEKGANPSAVTDGEYPGHKEKVRRTVLMWHLYPCDEKRVKMLVENGAEVNYINEENDTVLDLALKYGDGCEEVIHFLQENGGKTYQELETKKEEL